MKKALIVVDYSKDFVATDGALTAGEPAQVLDTYIADSIKSFIESGDYVAIANDLHTLDDPYHPETKLFPPHNLEGTEGREIYGKTGEAFKYYENHDNLFFTDKRRYSAFAGTEVDLRLRERGINEVWIVGVVTDICILHTAMSAYNLGYKIIIPEAGVASFNQAGHEWALDHFENSLGATVIRNK